MQPRVITNIPENEVVEFNESIHVQGSIGKNAKVTLISGNLKVDGTVESGANIDVQLGKAELYKVVGPGTRVKALQSIDIQFQNGSDVKLKSKKTNIMFNNCDESKIKGTIKIGGVTVFRNGVQVKANSELSSSSSSSSSSLSDSDDSDDDTPYWRIRR